MPRPYPVTHPVTHRHTTTSFSTLTSSSSHPHHPHHQQRIPKTRDAKKEFLEEHLPGAQKFDVDAVSDPSSPLPHMLPTASAFSEAASSLGLENKDHIVVYTTQKCFSAARCWWTVRE